MLSVAWARAAGASLVSSSFNAGLHDAALDEDAYEVWLSALLPTTREAHAQAHGTTTAPGEPFDVGGEFLMFPGDPAGSPENTCNCMCIAVPSFDRSNIATQLSPEEIEELLTAAGYAHPVKEVSAAARLRQLIASATGPALTGPVIFEGEGTGDKRKFTEGALVWEDGPIPLILNLEEMSHWGSIVGTITSLKREGSAIVATEANLSETDHPETAADIGRLVEMLNEGSVGVSVLCDDESITWTTPDGKEVQPQDDDPNIDWDEVVMTTTHARIRHVAFVDVPAFIDARLSLVDAAPVEEAAVDEDIEASAWAAFSQLPPMPAAWFAEPKDLPQDKGAVFYEDGRVFGWVARAGVPHEVLGRTPPLDDVDLTTFLRHPAQLDDGSSVGAGVYTMNIGHDGDGAHCEDDVCQFDDTGTVAGIVTVGVNEGGMWFSGAAAPWLSEWDRRVFAACQGSGHWRFENGAWSLRAVLSVPVPGFPTPLAASAVVHRSNTALRAVTPPEGEASITVRFEQGQLDAITNAVVASLQRQSEADEMAALVRQVQVERMEEQVHGLQRLR